METRVVGYIRVSTEGQAYEGVSLAAQEAKLRAYADLYGLTLVAIVPDAGVSAKTLDRPGLAEALRLLDAGEADAILVAKLDRLTRSVVGLGSLIDRFFRPGGKSLMSVAEQVDTRTAAGRMVLNLLTTVAQWEREAIGERTSTALRHKQAVGEHVGSVPFGYKLDRQGGRLVEITEESAVVTRVAEMRQSGKTLQLIADSLNAEGVQTKRGGKWYPTTVRNVLARDGASA